MSGDIDEGWRISYFETVVVDVLGAWLGQFGFARIPDDNFAAVLFERPPVRLRVHYLPEEPAPHSPMVSIGFAPTFDPALKGSMIGLWYAMPREAGDYSVWSFDDAARLSAVLARIRDEVIDHYARPLWETPETLRGLLQRQWGELKEAQRLRLQDQARADAARAFGEHDYARAASLYGSLPADALSGLELKRLEFARSRAGRRSPTF